MKVNWVLTSDYLPSSDSVSERLKSIGPLWGSWKTWRDCGTDNVICHDFAKAKELTARAFQAVCNFYLPKKFYQDLQRPVGVRLYDGDYAQTTDHIEDIISLHLAGQDSDIILMLGFDLRPVQDDLDKLEKHKWVNRHGLIRSAIVATPNVQYVLVDHPVELAKNYQNLPNLTCDTMENALKLLI